MADLTNNAPRRWRGARKTTSVPIAAATKLYAGAAVQEDGSGTVVNGTGAGTTFVGILLEEGDNSGGVAGDVRAECAYEGDFFLTVASGTTHARTDVGATVYITDGNTFTTVATAAQAIGKVVEVPEDAVGASSAGLWVHVEGVIGRSL